MRCIAGVLIFIVLYFTSCYFLGGCVRHLSGAAAGAEALRKYHALLAVAAGVAAITSCWLPGALAKKSREAEWRQWEEWHQS